MLPSLLRAGCKRAGEWRGHETISRVVRERMLAQNVRAMDDFTVTRYLQGNATLVPFLAEFGGDARSNAFMNGRPNALGALLWTETMAGLAGDVAKACKKAPGANQGAGERSPAGTPGGDPQLPNVPPPEAPPSVPEGQVPEGQSPEGPSNGQMPNGATLEIALLSADGDAAAGRVSFLCDVSTTEARQRVWAAVMSRDDIEAMPSPEFREWDKAVGALQSQPGVDLVSEAYLSLFLHPFFLIERS
jgi:hypothetical protein